jgi:hypothetical protein
MIRALNGRLGIKSYTMKMMSGSDKINQKIDFFAQIILSSAFFSSSFVALYQLFSIREMISFSDIFVSSKSIRALLFHKFTFASLINAFLFKVVSISLEQLEQCIQEIESFVFMRKV